MSSKWHLQGKMVWENTSILKTNGTSDRIFQVSINYPQLINKVQESLLNLPNINNLVKARTKLQTQLSNLTH